MSRMGYKNAKVWVEIADVAFEQVVEIPEDCFNPDGSVDASEVAEFVEIWIMDTLKQRYGCCACNESPEYENNTVLIKKLS
jgi:hypothetical protein